LTVTVASLIQEKPLDCYRRIPGRDRMVDRRRRSALSGAL